MLVSSGVEFSKVGQAQDDPCPASGSVVERRLYRRRAGGLPLGGEHPDDHLDAQSRSSDYWLGWAAASLHRGPTSWPSGWSAPPGRRHRRRPRKLTLDTVYFLKARSEPMVSKEYPHRGRKSITRSCPTACTSMWTGGPSFRRHTFATNYGGMDMKFRLDIVRRDTPAGWPTSWSTRYRYRGRQRLPDLATTGFPNAHSARPHRLLF